MLTKPSSNYGAPPAFEFLHGFNIENGAVGEKNGQQKQVDTAHVVGTPCHLNYTYEIIYSQRHPRYIEWDLIQQPSRDFGLYEPPNEGSRKPSLWGSVNHL
jgi:hypothetical protein